MNNEHKSQTNSSQVNKLSKKELRRAAWRWTVIGSNNINYGTLQGTGYAWALANTLRKVYPNDDDYVEAMNVEYEYFNITPYMAPLVIGTDVAMQEQQGTESLEAVRSIKTSLMGPLSGIGDSLLWVLYPTIMGSISGYMALDGNPLGAIAWIVLNLLLIWFRLKLFDLGYKSGARLITDLSDRLTAITEGASVMGLTVVGSLIATVVEVHTPLEFTFGEVTLGLQEEVFDQILPALLPVILTGVVYYLMEKRKWGFLKIIFAIIILSLVGSYFGILGVES
ncbi:PTS system mannose/fructose/sorbose family transporter subunit IID [Tetragenococcus koreensis]|uniref:PTS system mannose/fructose/sorbose family transporter subunit IID n=1 Tax=Tetragenococcus koreensis TaxID=290335 RepID=UPI000F4F6F35|nr:PTS system mannose/fructose/sorbose family transporter subunit IID [Tetragenococcus koreensis]AYW46535.1 PTS fructose transporter subunit IID [Tetragenococcus koreensis]MCF1619737.1 PTS system mannose/fructose/sorbose family transporter subunit IID [Tetragenococcus koreensis]MCF1657220.1 PTS system mannose/fructose/sorbose family transporter subunit IID [Tetragenococcus koreensis]GEN91797.1 PTS N-acetylglucosamine transporter subunit IIABC [Tetragenococcus koreensis]